MVIVLSGYVNKRIETEEIQMEYDTKLKNATYDAIKAYQINTVNSIFGSMSSDKVSDIESAVNTFYNSLSSNFGYSGYKASVMKEYVPAIVFTLYDGYYIYSPFKNTLTDVAPDGYDSSYSERGQETDGLKPYVYYTCRYKKGSLYDFIITYTMDNYITLEGNINTADKYIYDYGYLYSVTTTSAEAMSNQCIYWDELHDTYIYDGITFSKDDTEQLKEYLGNKEYSYVKINGTKYYLDEDEGSRDLDENGVNKNSSIFIIDTNGRKNYQQAGNYDKDREKYSKYYFAITKNKSAYEYYKNAYRFSRAVLGSPVNGYTDKMGTPVQTGGYGLKNLKTENAEIYANPASTETTHIDTYGNFNIFEDNKTEGIFIQNASSNFNKHRKSIIRYVVETNLASAISGFSSKLSTQYIMPKITEEDWDLIENDICAISFLQGMSINAKIYNGYSVVANTLTDEYIDENDIYILTDNNMYSKANDKAVQNHIKPKDNFYAGIWKVNFQKKRDISEGMSVYYYPMSYINNGNLMGYLGSYTSINGSSGIMSMDMARKTGNVVGVSVEDSDMYTYMHNCGITQLKEVYYKALGRERWGAFNINNVNYGGTNNNINYFLEAY